MKKFLGLALLAGALGTGNLWAISACTGTEFTLAGGFDDATTLGGTLDINTTTGTVCGGNVEIGNFGISALLNGSGGVYDSGYEAWSVDFQQNDIATKTNYTVFLDIDLSQQTSTNSLVGYSGGNFCIASSEDPLTGSCTNGQASIESSYNAGPDPFLTSGTLSDSPEPASFFLLAGPAIWFGLRRLRAAQQ